MGTAVFSEMLIASTTNIILKYILIETVASNYCIWDTYNNVLGYILQDDRLLILFEELVEMLSLYLNCISARP